MNPSHELSPNGGVDEGGEHPLSLPKLRVLTGSADASVAIASFPLPAGFDHAVGFDGLASQAVPIAWRPDGKPRQMLMLGLADGPLPDALQVTQQPQAHEMPARPTPQWTVRILHKKKTGMLMHEVNELTLSFGGREVGLRMGMRRSDGLHWWQWLRVEELWSGPVCRAIRAAGFIAADPVPEDFFIDSARYNTGYWLHRHNWLYAEVYALLFANGLVRATARHVNNRFFDKGEEIRDCLPVLGLRTRRGDAFSSALDGSRFDFDLDDVHLDMSRSSDLHGPEHPGLVERDGELTIVQPYEGAEIKLGEGAPCGLFELGAHDRRFWPGLARSFGFDLSLADALIRTRRYLPPWGWISHCGVIWPDVCLPARGPLEPTIDATQRKYEDQYSGAISRRFLQTSAFWDGEHAHALMIHAYRSADAHVYRSALHHAYAMADLGVDHTDFTVRIWYMKRHSTGQVLQRMLGILTCYLEEGDPYLLRVAESVADAAYAMDRSNWPRRSYGRDGAYIRSLTRLYDVTGNRHWLARAGEACRRAAQCQRPDGSFTDQGGATGAHGHLNEIVKPWMNSILSEAMVDYLERAPDDEAVAQAVIRCADWLLSVLQQDEDGLYWPYEVAFGENDGPPYAKVLPERPQTRHPAGEVQLDYNARTLLWVSRRTGDPRYARAWQQTYQRQYVRKGRLQSSYGQVKVPENFTWHEAHLWGATWERGELKLSPMLELIEPDRSAVIELPDGRSVRVHRDGSGVAVEQDASACASAAGHP